MSTLSSINLPRGPKAPPVAQLVEWMARPFHLLDRCHAEYGDTFTLRIAGFGRVVFVSDPASLKQVLTSNGAVLDGGRGSEMLRCLVGDTSIFLLEGNPHTRQRRMLLPCFQGERLDEYAHEMQRGASEVFQEWRAGDEIDLLEACQRVSLNIMLRTVFGLQSSARSEMTEISRLILDLYAELASPLIFLRRLEHVPVGPYARVKRLRRALDKILFELISSRRNQPAAERSDVLSMLIAARDSDGAPMNDVEIRDALVTLLTAGYETSSLGTTWAVLHILSNPEVHRRVRADIDGVEDATGFARSTYLDAVSREALRLYPVVPLFARHAMADCSIGGHHVPAGSIVAPCPYLAHRRVESFSAPETFDPNRFIGTRVDPYAWLPFGGGARRCLGMPFALMEMKVVLGALFATSEIELVSKFSTKAALRYVNMTPARAHTIRNKRKIDRS